MGVISGPNTILMSTYSKIYEWDDFYQDSGSPASWNYTINNSSSITNTFTRIHYRFKFDSYVVFIEFDDFTGGDINKVGVPINWTYEVNVSNMIYGFTQSSFPNSDVTTLQSQYPIVEGRINFWPSNYNSLPTGKYDHDDGGYSSTNGYGSMQFFNMSTPSPQTIFSYSSWGSTPIIGFGEPQTHTHPDWTFFTSNASTFSSTPNLGQVYVNTST